MAATNQFQFFEVAKTWSCKLFQFYNHIPHDMEMYMSFFQGFTEIKNGRHELHNFLWGQRRNNVQVVLLKFKMATTSQFFKYLWPQNPHLIIGGGWYRTSALLFFEWEGKAGRRVIKAN